MTIYCTNERKARINESANQRINESTNQRINESANQRINESANQRINGQWSKISDQSHPSSLRQGVSRNPEVLGGWAGFVYSSIRLFVLEQEHL